MKLLSQALSTRAIAINHAISDVSDLLEAINIKVATRGKHDNLSVKFHIGPTFPILVDEKSYIVNNQMSNAMEITKI
jgi:hypothetical protein